MGTKSGYAQSAVASAAYSLPTPTSTVTSLSVSSGGNPVSSVAAGSAVVLSATVTASGAAVGSGTIDFCDATVTLCTDVHLIGTAQLNSAGVAAITLTPGIGTHSYKAAFMATSVDESSSSIATPLSVTGQYPTTTSITNTTGGPGNYTLQVQVSGLGNKSAAPTGSVDIVDTTAGNVALGSGVLSGGSASLTFGIASSPPAGNGAQRVVTADFNGDGKPDLAIVNYYDNTVTILLNAGNSAFTQAVASPITVGNGPWDAAVGDFNGDGKVDLAVVNENDNTVSVLIGNGDGTFTAAPSGPIAVGVLPTAITVSDINHDGNLDLVVSNRNDGTVTILVGNGDGSFAASNGSPLTIGFAPGAIVSCDLNGDGIPDLAVADPDNYDVGIFLGHGDGTFSQASGSPVGTGNGPASLVAADFNRDGRMDLAVGDSGTSDVTILMGNGDGTFTPSSDSPITGIDWPDWVSIGDFNNDGQTDLAIANNDRSTVTILAGNGDGTFSAITGSPFAVGTQPRSIAIADVNGDGIADIATSNWNASSPVTVLQASEQFGAFVAVNNIAPLGNGNHSVDANYGGNANYTSSTSPTTQLEAVANYISSVSPATGGAGTSITITGGGFGSVQGSNSVTIGGAPAAVTSWNDTQIQAQIPNGSGPGPQPVLINIGGQSGTSSGVTVTPAIATLTPSTGFAGDAVQIAGTNFGGLVAWNSNVTFNGTQVQITNWTQSGIMVRISAGVTTGPVVVTACNPDASWCGPTNGVVFTAPTTPTITTVSPVTSSVGSTVTIGGQNFGTTVGTVTFNGVAATPTTWGSEAIVTPVPQGATTGPVVVNAGGTASNSYPFTISGGITGISPNEGASGTTVTISGTGFGASQSGGTVTFNGIAAPVSSWSDTSIVVTAPTAGTTGHVSVLSNGASTLGPVYSYPPAITGLSPNSGPVGTLVTISGSNFGMSQSGSGIAFGQVSAFPTQWGQNSITVPVPVGTVSGPLSVVVNGLFSNQVTFTVNGSGATGGITGRVTQPDGVTPIQSAAATVLSGNIPVGSASTNSSGIYSVSGLPPGTYGVQTSAFGYGAASQSGVVVIAGQSTQANFTLTAQTTVSYAYDADGRLVGVSTPSQGAAAYSYDPVGNILSISRTGSGQVSVLSFSPIIGPVGTQVTISGTGFSPNPLQDTVTVNGTTAAVNSASTTQLIITVPIGATTGPISVTSPSGTASSTAQFTVGVPVGSSSITSFTPNSGPVGSIVTITGSGFDVIANDQVEFDGYPAYVSAATPTTITAAVPAQAQSGPISVTTPLGSATSSADFFVVPAGYTGGQIDFEGQITAGGQPYTGTIINGGDMGMVVFNAVSGQQFNLTASSSTLIDATISILNPQGVQVQSSTIGSGGSVLQTIVAPTSGAYTVLISSPGVGFTGSVTLSLTASSPGQNGGSSLSLQVYVTTAGQTAIVPFTGTAGQQVSVLINNSTFPNNCAFGLLGVSILNPDGSTLTSANLCATLFLAPVTLPTSGTYSVVIAPQSGGTGSAAVVISLFNAVVVPVTPVPSGTTSFPLTINSPGQQGKLTFSGTAGQLASVLINNSTFPNNCAFALMGVSILNPDGSTLTSANLCANLFLAPVSLPSTGTYALVIAPGSGGTGSATVLLSLFMNQTGTISPGTPQNVIITAPGQEALFTFGGAAGQQATVQLYNAAFPANCAFNPLILSILNPNGSTLASTNTCGLNGSIGPTSLPSSGTYTVVVAPGAGGVGTATVSLTTQ